jgi:2-dehydro-3-deoxygluconokinase
MASVEASTLLENIDLGEVTMVYVSGILPALSQSAANNAIGIVEAAANAGCTLVVDANYRNKLWTSDDARPVYESMFAKSDVIVMASRDIESIFGYSGDHFVMGERLCQEFSASHVIVTQGADGALSVSADGNVCSKDAIPVLTRDPIGAGDAFVGAVCACMLKEEDLEVAIEYGVAAAAISRATFGDLTPLTEEKIRDVSDSGIVR